MALTDILIRSSKPKEKPYRLSDAEGMYLEVMPNGSKYWRLKYRFSGKEKRLALGVYPEITLKDARDKRDKARKLLTEGIDPSEYRRAVKAAGEEKTANSFEVIAREWYSKHSGNWVDSHSKRILSRLESDVFPWLGSKPIADITAPELLAAMRRIESRGALETAHRVLGSCGQIFRYAVATGRALRDPSGDLRGALPPVKGKHFAAVTEPKAVGELLRAINGYKGGFIVKCALRLAPLVFVRPGELRTAKWADIDLDAAEWRFTATKTDTQLIVPLAPQAMAILEELQPVTGKGEYLFPSSRSHKRPMSDNALLSALRRMGVEKDEMSGHGWRACARTLLDEVLGIRPDIIEHQLGHAVKDPNGRAYNRTAHLPERRKMMVQWANYLDSLQSDGKVLPFKQSNK